MSKPFDRLTPLVTTALHNNQTSGNYALFRGKCKEYSAKAVADNPQLTLVRGHYVCPQWGMQPHWWTVTPTGEVYDPTALQFPSCGCGTYIPFDTSTSLVACESCGKRGLLDDFAIVNGRHPVCKTGDCYKVLVLG